ncbi:MAG: tRNA(Met) cytidine acetyltransferase TmcA [Halobacteriota archaeon]
MDELLQEVVKAQETSRNNNHRFIIMLGTTQLDEKLFLILDSLFKYINTENTLIAGRSHFMDAAQDRLQGKFIHYKDCSRVLGSTYSSLILDLTEGINPNDLGVLVETVSGGGAVILICPRVEDWYDFVGKWEEDLADLSKFTPRFNRRFISRTLESSGVIIYDVHEGKLNKTCTSREPERGKEAMRLPHEEKEIKKKLYKLCATQDQVRVLELFEGFFDREREKKSVIITADRGRGKTAVLGIVTPYIISRMNRVLKRPIRIMVVAPGPESVQTYFDFLKKSLLRQGMSDFKTKGKKMTTVLTSKFARVEYAIPRRALIDKDHADIIIVDEAAGIDPVVLAKITSDKRYTIFSSTIHGYEGAGRGIYRFMSKLEREDTELKRIHLEEPIRYDKNDPVERWLYDVLLLDAQPAELAEEDVEKIRQGDIYFEEMDKNELMENDQLLREFFGIYVLAHYRNKPSDLVILANLHNHLPFRVTVNGKTICSLHVATEGGIDQETIDNMAQGFQPRGHIIPDVVLKHYWIYEFPRLTGARIVRIATHPAVNNMGAGSFALQEIMNRASNMDWVGSSFGISLGLVKFWNKNGFLPVHITPHRKETSGEHSVVMMKALNQDLNEKVRDINSHFTRRLIEYLGDELKDIDTRIGSALLEPLTRDAPVPYPILNEGDNKRMEKYLEGASLLEYVSDIVRPLVKYHYSRAERVPLTPEEQEIAVGKCLQHRTWKEVDNRYEVLQSAVRKIWEQLISEQKWG